LLCCCAAAAWSAATDDCRALGDDARRLACYDQLFPRRLISAPPPTQAAATSAGVAPASPQQRSAPDPQFGMNEAQRRAAAGNTEQSKINDSISATITDLRTTPSGEFVVILDNGQVWRQIDLESWAPPQKGDRVTIHRGALGSFMLVTANNLATHVRRER
jgi:hypothetical protein